MSFDALGLTPELLRAVADQGYTEPTPVQREAIPLVLAGRDLLAGAQTGTGKTAAFVLPILQRLNAGPAPSDNRTPGPSPIRCLVLTPTRELALQVEESVRTYGAQRRVRSVAIYGGVGYDPQIRALRAGPAVVVATPGRLLDHIAQRHIDLSRLEVLVLDEADRMLDMGFIRDIRKVIALLPAERQNLLFSATFSDEIRTLANSLLHNPKSVEVARRNTTVEVIEQSMHRVPQAHKRDLLAHLIKHHDWQQVLVFTRTKHGANKLAEKLIKDGISAAAIHGNKSQGARTKALASFKDGGVRVLVATDIAARGIDIDQLPQVVNFELPNVPEDYVHRIGRTGRAGTTGSALSLVDDEEMSYLRDIEKLIRRAIVRVEIEPGFVPPAKADLMSDERPPRPPQGRGGQRQGQGSGRGGQPGGGRSGSGRASQPKPASAGAKPAGGRSGAPGQSTQARKPRPQAALFSAKPGTRGH